MTVIVTKDAINLREKLSELDKETGIKGEELMRADTSAEARDALQLDQQLFTDFESTGIDDNATSTVVTIDSSNNVGIGTSSPISTASLHIQGADGASGSIVNVAANEFFIDNNGNTGMTLGSSNTGSGGYAFADSDVALRAGMFYDHSNDQMSFRVASQTRVSIDSSGNLLLNTANSPTTTKAIISADYSASGTTNTGITIAGRQTGNWWNNGIHALGSSGLVFSTGTTGISGADATNERMRIDSSGNLLVGKTATGLDVEGIQIVSGGLSGFTRDAGVALVLNRETDDGNVMQFRKDNSVIGSIGVNSNDLTIGNNDIGLRFSDSGNLIRPHNLTSEVDTDGTTDLGTTSGRFKDLYLSGGAYLGGTAAANKLDDYEEGIWTPLLVPQTGAFTSQTIINYLTDKPRYTKIGNLVMVSVLFTTYELTKGTASGNVYLGGLPFEVYTSSAATITLANDFLGDNPSSGSVFYQSDKIGLRYRTSPNGGDLALQVTDLGTNDGDNAFQLTLVYRTQE